jgi:hypothetical protein
MASSIQKFLDDFFYKQGMWSLVAGNTHNGFLGSRLTFVEGAESKLVTSPIGALSFGKKSPIMDLLLGLGDDVSFCFGARVSATYGGPAATILRGPEIKKIGTLYDMPGQTYTPPGLLDPDPAWPGEVKKGKPIELQDQEFGIVVAVLGVLLNAVTIALEYSMRLKLNNSFNETTGVVDITTDPSDALQKVKMAQQLIPRRLEALIYHLEVSSTWELLSFAFMDAAIRLGNICMIVTVIPGLIYLGVWLFGTVSWKLQAVLRLVGVALVVIAILILAFAPLGI